MTVYIHLCVRTTLQSQGGVGGVMFEGGGGGGDVFVLPHLGRPEWLLRHTLSAIC